MRPHGPGRLNRFSGDGPEGFILGTAYRARGHGHVHGRPADAFERSVLERVHSPAGAYVRCHMLSAERALRGLGHPDLHLTVRVLAVGAFGGGFRTGIMEGIPAGALGHQASADASEADVADPVDTAFFQKFGRFSCNFFLTV